MFLSHEDTQRLLSLAAEPCFVFSLTGSRYFGHCNTYSDIDLYTLDSPEVRSFLLSIGFLPNEESSQVAAAYSGDPNVSKVFQSESAGIQIQLVSDVRAKTEVQSAITMMCLPEYVHKDKSQMKIIWAACFRLYTNRK